MILVSQNREEPKYGASLGKTGERLCGSPRAGYRRPDDSGRKADGTSRPQWMRKINAAVSDLRPSEPYVWPDLFRRPGCYAAASGKAGDRPRFPELRPLSPHDCGAEHCVSPGESKGQKRGDPGTHGGNGKAGADRRSFEAEAQSALRRPAAAGGHRPGAGEAARDPAAG